MSDAVWHHAAAGGDPSRFVLPLSEILHPDDMKQIEASGHLVFHTVGDTGGIKDPDHQHIVARAHGARWQLHP